MATIINNPPSERTEKTVIESSDSSGWVVTVIILLLLIIGGVYLWMHYRAPAQATQPGANINVTLPAGSGNTSGDGTQYPAQ